MIPLGRTSSIGIDSDTAWTANVFTATNSEAIEAVGLFTNQVNTTYQIFIYTNPDAGTGEQCRPGFDGARDYRDSGIPHGYPADTRPVNAGQKFSVVVRLQTPNYEYPIAIEEPFDGYSSQATASAGQSYVSSTGSTWTDLTSIIFQCEFLLKGVYGEHGNNCSGCQLHCFTNLRDQPAYRHIHGYFHQLSDFLGLDLWRWGNFYAQEPVTPVHNRWNLHRNAEGNERRR